MENNTIINKIPRINKFPFQEASWSSVQPQEQIDLKWFLALLLLPCPLFTKCTFRQICRWEDVQSTHEWYAEFIRMVYTYLPLTYHPLQIPLLLKAISAIPVPELLTTCCSPALPTNCPCHFLHPPEPSPDWLVQIDRTQLLLVHQVTN